MKGEAELACFTFQLEQVPLQCWYFYGGDSFFFLKQQVDLAGKWHFSFMIYLEVPAFGFVLMRSKTKVFSNFSQEQKRVRQELGDRALPSTMSHLGLVAKPLLIVISGGDL